MFGYTTMNVVRRPQPVRTVWQLETHVATAEQNPAATFFAVPVAVPFVMPLPGYSDMRIGREFLPEGRHEGCCTRQAADGEICEHIVFRALHSICCDSRGTPWIVPCWRSQLARPRIFLQSSSADPNTQAFRATSQEAMAHLARRPSGNPCNCFMRFSALVGNGNAGAMLLRLDIGIQESSFVGSINDSVSVQ
jgi:hypothetical protein